MAIKFLNDIDKLDNIQFVNSSGTNAGLINMDGNDLVLSNTLGDVLLGDGASDVYIGDGINNVDILFEQSGTISAESASATLTLGGAGGSLAIQSPTVNGTSYFTGSVGIGVASPGSTLHVNGDVRAEDFLCRNSTDTLTVGYLQENSSGEGVLRINNGSNWGLIARGIGNGPVVGAWYNGSLTFRGFGASSGDTDVNDVDVMTVDFANQRVGIGTTSPDSLLHVYGASNPVFKVEDDGGAWGFMQAAGSDQVYVGSGPSANLNIYAGLSSAMTILASNRNVGIGTNSPHNKAHITSSGNQDGLLLDLTTGSSGDYTGVYFKVDNNTTNAYKKGGLVWERTGSYNEGRFHFLLNNEDNTNNVDLTDSKFTILSTGNVGIGTTSPSQGLHVVDAGIITSEFESSDNSSSLIEVSNNAGLDAFFGVAGGNLVLRHDDYTANHFAMDSSGNVGIGTASPAQTLDVNGNANITGTLDVTTSSPTGSPLVRFYQSTTRRGFIQMADTNDNLRVASEYGSVSLEAAATSGVDSDTSYIRIKPGGTVEIGAVDGDATISTDGSMTFKIDADNDETSQKFSFVNNAGTEVASIDESGNLTLTGGINLSLPTSPGTTGTLWNDRGTVRVS